MPTAIDIAIERTPGVCGGDARIHSTRIPVWLLVGYRKDGVSDARLLEMYPSLSLGDLSSGTVQPVTTPTVAAYTMSPNAVAATLVAPAGSARTGAPAGVVNF